MKYRIRMYRRGEAYGPDSYYTGQAEGEDYPLVAAQALARLMARAGKMDGFSLVTLVTRDEEEIEPSIEEDGEVLLENVFDALIAEGIGEDEAKRLVS